MNDTRHRWAIGLALIGACSALHAADVTLSTCALVDLKSAHPLRQTGKNPFMTTQRLALIENGTVGCAHRETFETARCTFNVQQDARGEAGAAGPLAAHSGASGHWVEDAKGRRYAVAGQAIALNGARRGPYIVAAAVEDGKVPCTEGARSRDAVGTSASQELAFNCTVEAMGSPVNASGLPLRHYASLPVCTSSYPHPDGARLHSADPANGVYCYVGEGAGLNDPNGIERDRRGYAIGGKPYCHVGWSGGVEVFVGKRPATIGIPSPGRVNPKTPIVWRPVTSVRVAN